ncbi:MAG: tetratricopeptide repeat protein [Chloroflexi bacterium]|nr:tetratricopeptide repeat protein [Chloroflexota bacterium]
MTDKEDQSTKYHIHIEKAEGVIIGDKAQVTQQLGLPEGLRRFDEKIEIPTPPFQFVQEVFPPFVNRMAEIEKLRTHFAHCLKNEVARVVLVRGEVGIGKTRLINEFVGQLVDQKRAVCTIRTCAEGIPGSRLLGQIASDVSQLCPCRPNSVSPQLIESLVNRLQQGHSFSATSELGVGPELIELAWAIVGAFAEVHPIVIAIEDLDCGDRDTLFFLQQGATGRAGQILIIGSYRPAIGEQAQGLDDILHQTRVGCLELRGLSRNDTRTLIGHSCPSPAFGADFYEVVHDRTGGNPSFVIEVIEDLKQKGIISQTADGAWRVAQDVSQIRSWIPVRLADLVRAQFRDLKQVNRRAARDARSAAVIGRQFLVQILQRIANYSDQQVFELMESIEAMEAHRLVQRWDDPELALVDRTYAFRSSITWELLYQPRPDLHRQIADILLDLYPDPAAQRKLLFWRAWHYQRAGAPEQAVKFLRLAAEESSLRQLPYEAIEFRERLLDQLRQLPKEIDPVEEATLLKEIASLEAQIGRLDEALEHYREAAEAATKARDKELQIELVVETAWVMVKQERFEEAESLFGEAERSSRGWRRVSPPLLSLLHRRLAALYLEKVAVSYNSGSDEDLALALYHTREAEAGLRAADPKQKRMMTDWALLLNSYGRVFFHGQQYARARKAFEEGLAICQRAKDETTASYILNNLGSLYMTEENYAQAETYFRNSLIVTEREDNLYLRAKTLLNLGDLYTLQNLEPDAIRLLEEALWISRLLKHQSLTFDTACNLGSAYFNLREYDAADQHFQIARKIRPAHPFPAEMLDRISTAFATHVSRNHI